ncbi:hypothetical protein [Coleofasciculus sp. H7-2]
MPEHKRSLRNNNSDTGYLHPKPLPSMTTMSDLIPVGILASLNLLILPD